MGPNQRESANMIYHSPISSLPPATVQENFTTFNTDWSLTLKGKQLVINV